MSEQSQTSDQGSQSQSQSTEGTSYTHPGEKAIALEPIGPPQTTPQPEPGELGQQAPQPQS